MRRAPDHTPLSGFRIRRSGGPGRILAASFFDGNPPGGCGTSKWRVLFASETIPVRTGEIRANAVGQLVLIGPNAGAIGRSGAKGSRHQGQSKASRDRPRTEENHGDTRLSTAFARAANGAPTQRPPAGGSRYGVRLGDGPRGRPGFGCAAQPHADRADPRPVQPDLSVASGAGIGHPRSGRG
jgi:hypothetical protein